MIRRAATCFVLCCACSKPPPPEPARVTSSSSSAELAPSAPAPSTSVTHVADAGAPPRTLRPRRERTRRFVLLPTDDRHFEPKKVRTEPIEVGTIAQLYAARDARKDHVSFEGFDADSLYFVFLHWERSETIKQRARVERRVRVARSLETEGWPGVGQTLDFFEVGKDGVRGGMDVAELIKQLGEPISEVGLGAFGNCDFVYADRTVRFIQNRVGAVFDKAPSHGKVAARSGGHCAGRLGR